jgi:hypothetical protein
MRSRWLTCIGPGIVAAVCAATLLREAYADEASKALSPVNSPPDFYLVFSACRSSAASFAPGDKAPIASIDTKGHIMACVRVAKRQLSCLIDFEDKSAKPVTAKFFVDTELSSMTILTHNDGADYVVIRPGVGVVSTTRLFSSGFLGAKICHGTYVTADEASAFEKKARAGK